MTIFLSLMLLITLIIVCKYKNVRIEYMSAVYNSSLFFLIFIFTENYENIIFFMLTVLTFILLIILLCRLEYRIKKINFKQNIYTKFMVLTIILEEIFFREILFNSIGNSFNFLFISSLFFGLVHTYFSKKDIFLKLILGFILSYAYIETENLYATLFIHLLYNVFILKLEVVNQYDKN